MPHKLRHWLISNIYILSLIFINGVLLIANIQVNKYLSGWDNLQVELSPVLNVKRAVFSVWEEYQSFGLLAGLAHAADLPHTIFIFVLSWLLPNWLVRYVFHSCMLLLGSLGMYLFLKRQIFKGTKAHYAFLGALFYLLNFGTIQIFFIPLEAFSVFFGFLPWLVFAYLQLFDGRLTQKKLLFLTALNFLATPMSHVQTVFLVYMLTLGMITVPFLVTQKNELWRVLRVAVVAFAVIIAVNLYWLMPQVYFAKDFRSVVDNAKINQLATDNVYQQNQGSSNLESIMTFKGFYFDQSDAARTPLFSVWQKHFQIDLINILPYVFFIIILFGFIHKKQTHYVAFLLLFLLCAVALLSTIPPFSYINGLLRSSGFISQVFRSPFTKFITLYTFVAAYFFALGLDQIAGYFKKVNYRKAFVITIFVFIFVYALPAFQGNYFSPKMKVTIPDKYFQMMGFFKQQDKNKRVALLPDYTFWGWFNHSWGYYGSGFLWYGIEQPIVSRTFDVWSKESEGYFWEVKQALQSESPADLERVMDKYNIDYIIFDESVLPLNAAKTSKQFALLESILSQSKVLTKVQAWDKLTVYERRNPAARNVNNFISRRNSVPNIGPDFFVTNSDRAYNEHGTYKTDTSKPFDFFYPFIDFMTQTRFPKPTWEIDEAPGTYQLSRQIPFDIGGYELSIATDEAPLASSGAEITAVGNSRLRATPAPVNQFDTRIRNLQAGFSAGMNEDWLVLNIPKINLVNFDVRNTTVNDCDFGKKDIQANTTDASLSVKVFNSSTACFSYAAEFLPQSYGYILTIENKNWLGQPLFFYVLDGTKESSFVEDRLRNPTDYFIMKSNPNIPPDFAVNFQANSYGPLSSTNDLYTVRMDVFPVDIITSIYYQRKNIRVPLGESLPVTARKNNYYSYTADVTGNTKQPSTLILYQAYHPGWKAYGPDGKELEHHYKINNWANGWDIPAGMTGKITLFFWPQNLEYIGFGIGLFAILVLSGWVWLQRRTHTPLPKHVHHE